MLLVAGIPAIAAIAAAVIAAVSARSAHQSDAQAARTKELEDRISERKYSTYEPMINFLRDIVDPNKSRELATNPETSAQVGNFATWIGIFGSDEAVTAFHNFMQAAFAAAPAPILIRLYADLMLAARRDMGYPDTTVTRPQVLGMRLNDLYRQPDFLDTTTEPFEDVCKKANWSPPWSASQADYPKPPPPAT